VKWCWLVLLAGCDPVWALSAHVVDDSQAPIPNAALSLVNCPGQNDQNVGDVAAITDDHGDAGVSGLGFAYPACDITVAKPGFQPFASSISVLCDGKIDDCERVQTITVVLSPDP